MLAWLVAIGLFAALGNKNGGGGGSLITLGVLQLRAGRSYHFETSVAGLAPSDAAAFISALTLAGAWDVIASPTTPLLISYSMTAPQTSALSVGVPYPVTAMGKQLEFTVRSVREVQRPRRVA